MIDFTHHVQAESARFAAAIRTAGPGALTRSVPPCPEWTLADLIWHLTEVQDFWCNIVGDGADGPEGYDRPDRPADDELLDFLVERSARLLTALDRPDEDQCWSWSPLGGTVGWVRRRQAQEALVHRVDAELTVGDRTPLDEQLAADGVDEILLGMLNIGELPEGSSFNAEESSVVLDTGDRWWSMSLGRFVAASPDGPDLDLPALRVEDSGLGVAPDSDTHIVGSGGDLNLWLWGRSDASTLTVTGDRSAADRLRATAESATN